MPLKTIDHSMGLDVILHLLIDNYNMYRVPRCNDDLNALSLRISIFASHCLMTQNAGGFVSRVNAKSTSTKGCFKACRSSLPSLKTFFANLMTTLKFYLALAPCELLAKSKLSIGEVLFVHETGHLIPSIDTTVFNSLD